MRGCVEHGPDAPKRVTLTPDAKVVKCAICGTPWYDGEPEAFQKEPNEAHIKATPEPAKKRSAASTRTTITAKSVIKEARAELKTRNKRIKQLERELKAEKKAATELQRVVDAADGRRLAVVKDLQRSSG